jgi:U3 small nucleolar RNA-associated protein MPP10
MQIESMIGELQSLLKNPEIFISGAKDRGDVEGLKDRLKAFVQLLYEKSAEAGICQSGGAKKRRRRRRRQRRRRNGDDGFDESPLGPLTELYLDGFDLEQVWQQIELRNAPLMRHVESKTDEFMDEAIALADGDTELEHADSAIQQTFFPTLANENDDDRSCSRSDSHSDSDSDSDSDSERIQMQRKNQRGNDSDDSNDDNDDGSELDDSLFFDMKSMEEFVDEAEQADMAYFQKLRDGTLDDDGASDSDDENDSDDSGDESDEGKVAKYSDFFDAPPKSKSIGNDGDDDDDDDDDFDNDELNRYGSDLDASDQDDDDDDDNAAKEKDDLDDGFSSSDDDDNDDSDVELTDKQRISRFLKEDRARQREIAELEDAAVAKKDWTMSGEVVAGRRPENSLLEVDLEFDHASNPPPIITEEHTRSLEDVIRARIIEERWDDVVRKQPIERGSFAPEAVPEVQDTKSEKGLGEIYEESYMLEAGKWERADALAEEHSAVQALYDELSWHLDALSNFHYTPKPPKAETAEVVNAPAVRMEEALPIGVSEANQMTPGELYAPKTKGVEAGEDELSHEERRAARRRRKTARAKQKRAEEADRRAVDRLNPGMGNKHAREKMLAELAQARNVDTNAAHVRDTDVSRQSTALFRQLQQEAAIGADAIRKQIGAASSSSSRKRRKAPASTGHKM